MQSDLTRRQLMQMTASGLALGMSGLGRDARAAEKTAPGDPAGGLALGIQSYTLRKFGLEAMLDHVRRLDLQRVEIYPGHFNYKSPPAEVEALKQKAVERGIQIVGFGVAGFGRDHAANRQVFEFARRAGIRNLAADPTPDSFDSLEKLVAEFDIRIAIHNHGPRSRYDKIDDVARAIKDRHPNIGACADLGHYIRSGEDPVAAIRQFRGRLFGVHLKDFAEPKADARGTILGQGRLDVAAVFRVLAEVQFPADGSLSLEYEEHPDNPLDDVKQCLAVATAASRKAKP